MCAFRTEASLKTLAQTREFVFARAREAGLPRELERKLDLVLEEVLVNIANYAYGEIGGELEVECESVSGSFCCTVRDWGPPFNPLEAAPSDISQSVDDRPVGGLGLMLVSAMSDSCAYARCDDVNELTFCFSH